MHWDVMIDELTTLTGKMENATELEVERHGLTIFTHLVSAVHGVANTLEFAREGETDNASFMGILDNAIGHLVEARKKAAAKAA